MRLQDLGSVEEMKDQEDNLHGGWMEIDEDQPTSRKRKRVDEGSVSSGESDLKYTKKVGCEGGCLVKQHKTTKSKKNNKKENQNIQTNKLGLSCSPMDIESVETEADRKKDKSSVSIAGKVTARKRWGKLRNGLFGWIYECRTMKKELPAIKSLTPSRVRGWGFPRPRFWT